MSDPYKNKTKGTEEHLALTDQVLESAYADIADERFRLIGKLKDKKITEEKFSQSWRELQAKGMKLLSRHQLTKSQEGFDHLVTSGYFMKRRQNAVKAYNQVFAPFSNMMSDADQKQALGRAGKEAVIPAKDVIRIWNAAGTITTSDATSTEDYTDMQVHYTEKPVNFLNVVQKRTITEQDIREFAEDSTKVEGTVGDNIAEKGTLALMDYGIKGVTRPLRTVGAYVEYTLQLANDSSRSHFMPYMNARMMEKHNLAIENAAINGLGTANRPTGMLAESGITSHTAVATGAWTVTKVNAGFKDAINSIIDNHFKEATHIVVHPTVYYDLLAIGSDDYGWHLGAPVSVNAPLGGSIPTLFGVPIIVSYTLAKATYMVVNLEDTIVYTNGANIQRDEGLTGTQLTSLERTIVMYCFMNQFSRFAKAIVKGTKTA